jgi:hypothetical protein
MQPGHGIHWWQFPTDTRGSTAGVTSNCRNRPEISRNSSSGSSFLQQVFYPAAYGFKSGPCRWHLLPTVLSKFL